MLTTTTTTTTTTTMTTTTTTTMTNPQIAQIDLFKRQKQSEDFYRRLIEFHKHKNVNTPLTQLPTLNGKLIDLQKLYNIVIGLGGWERVCEKDKWQQVGIELDSALFKSCLNGSHALKVVYIRYLSLYEKFDYQMSYSTSLTQGASISSLLDPLHNFNNPSLSHSISSGLLNGLSNGLSNGIAGSGGLGYHKSSAPNLEETLDSDLNRRRFSYLLELTPMNYNYNQHHHYHHSSSSTSDSNFVYNPYEKLEISLLSGLPNEVDFIFNTIVLLSSDESHAFKIYQSPRLVYLMLAHIGFFGTSDKYNLRSLYDNYWNKIDYDKEVKNEKVTIESFLNKDDFEELNLKYTNKFKYMTKRNFIKFWHDSVQMPISDEFNQKSLLEEIMPKLYNEYLKTLLPQELLNLRETRNDLHDSSTPNSIENRRIEQVMVVLNNLSFEENNANFMANKCTCLIEFLIMCLYCTNTNIEIRKHALDILANLSRKIKLKNLSEKLKQLLITSLYHLIVGLEENFCTEESNDNSENESQSKLITTQDRLDLIRGLEILTKLCSQEQIDVLDDDNTNEKILAKFMFNYPPKKLNFLFLEKIFSRLEELLTFQDVLILLNSLEFLYNISQYNQFICNLIVGVNQPKIISILVNFLTVDMSHFGVQTNDSTPSVSKPPSAPIKIYKIMPSNGQIIATTTTTTISNNSNQTNQSQPPQSPVSQANNIKPNSLLQQTLSNQHALSTNTPLNASNFKIIMNSPNNVNSKASSSEQYAKNILCNWLVKCFQPDSSSELSKTQLYPYYQQISKLNNWPVLTIPTFFEILNATFPNIRYEEDSNKIHGLKLILNLKQQLELKNEFAQNKSLAPTLKIITKASTEQKAEVKQDQSNNIACPKPTAPLSPPPSLSIFVQTPSLPLLTPPTPPVSAQSKPTVAVECQKPKESSSETSSVLTNGSNKANLLPNGDVLNHSEDSLSSTSSSSSTSIASSMSSSTKDPNSDEKSNKENDALIKRKTDSNDCQIKNESSAEKSNSDSNSTSPVKKKKLKINEMEEFMNKPMNPVNISQILPQASQQLKEALQEQKPVPVENKTEITEPSKEIAYTGDYLCEWNNCGRYFISSKAVYNHVCKYHLFFKNYNNESEGQLCLWSGCDQIKRQKWSLVNHLLERHCNENAMKTAIICRQRGIVPVSNSNQSLSVNYSKDAALFAIQRHHRLKKEDFSSSEEGPITKSLRLLSALTLRNLARNSDKAKDLIKVYESQLANIAFDLLESSNAISNCLWHLTH